MIPELHHQTTSTSATALRSAKTTLEEIMQKAIEGAAPDYALEPSTRNFNLAFVGELVEQATDGDENVVVVDYSAALTLLRGLVDGYPNYDQRVAALYHTVKDKHFRRAAPSRSTTRPVTPGPRPIVHSPPRPVQGTAPRSAGAVVSPSPLPRGSGQSAPAAPAEPRTTATVVSRAETEQRRATARSAAVGEATAKTIVRCNWLHDTMIQGRPMWDTDRRTGLAWCASNEAKNAWARHIFEALPTDTAVVRDFWAEEEAEKARLLLAGGQS